MDTKGSPFHLPSQQLPIMTSNVREFIAQTRLLMSTEGPPSSLGLVVGASGTGKTVAAHVCREMIEQEEHASCAILDVMPQMTARDFLSVILHQLGKNARPRTSHEALRQVIEMLQQGKARLIILDQSDYLERSALEVLALLVDKTPCSFLLIGLPHLLTRLNMVPFCADRVSLILPFRPLAEEEMYETFLPQVELPGWAFHPQSKEDLRIGKYLWENARPSLRRVCTILGYASYLAQMSNASNVTIEHIRQAIHMTGLSRSRKENEEETELSQSVKVLNRKRSSNKKDRREMLKSSIGESNSL